MIRSWVHSGFNIHRSRPVLPDQRDDLEQLAQYIRLRQPVLDSSSSMEGPSTALLRSRRHSGYPSHHERASSGRSQWVGPRTARKAISYQSRRMGSIERKEEEFDLFPRQREKLVRFYAAYRCAWVFLMSCNHTQGSE